MFKKTSDGVVNPQIVDRKGSRPVTPIVTPPSSRLPGDAAPSRPSGK